MLLFFGIGKIVLFSELEKLCFYFSGKLSSIYNFELPWQLHTLSDLLTKRQKDKKVKRQKDKRLKDKKTKRKVLYCDVSFAQGWKTFQWQGEYVPPPQLPYVTSASKPPHSPLAIFSSF